MEKKWDTLITADLKRLFVSGVYSYVPLVTKGLKSNKIGGTLQENLPTFITTLVTNVTIVVFNSGVRHPQHTQISSNSSTTAADNSTV
jgi:hypothetical protein